MKKLLLLSYFVFSFSLYAYNAPDIYEHTINYYEDLMMQEAWNQAFIGTVSSEMLHIVYSDPITQAALQRAYTQLGECLRARGENRRCECNQEFYSLAVCILQEALARNYQATYPQLQAEYYAALARIDDQFNECVRARGTNRKDECRYERDKLYANAEREFNQKKTQLLNFYNKSTAHVPAQQSSTNASYPILDFIAWLCSKK